MYVERWLSGRKRQTVNLLGNLTLVRIQLFSFILKRGSTQIFLQKKNETLFTNYSNFYKDTFLKYNTYFDPANYSPDPKVSLLQLNHYLRTFNYPLTTLNSYFQSWLKGSKPSLVNLRLYFKLTRFQVNLESTSPKYNIISLSPGVIFAKFFEKKGLRNRRQTQTILMRFLRKSLIFLNISNLNLIVRGLPFNLAQLIKVLATPISYSVSNPLRQGEIFTDTASRFNLQIWLVHFTKTSFFGKTKLKKKGRLKRKVARKIIMNNKLTD